MKKLAAVVFVIAMAFSGMASMPAVAQSDSVDILSLIDEGYYQSYEDRTEQKMLSSLLVVSASEDDASHLFDVMTSESEKDAATEDFTEIEDLGDEAWSASITESEGVLKVIVARQENLVIFVVALGWEDEPGLQEEAARFILETGKSDTEMVVSEDGDVSGGWADAFPQPDDIDSLAGLEPAPVYEFESPVPAATPATIRPVVISTPAS